MSHIEDTSREAPPPVLRFVQLDKVLPHEEPDEQRFKPLVERIVSSNVWLHPPIVAPLPDTDGQYVILDGANRCHSLKSLHFAHILVQIASYDTGQVTLDTWNHVVTHLAVDDFLEDIKTFESMAVEETDRLTAQAKLAQRSILAYIIDFKDNRVFSLQMHGQSLHLRNLALRQLVATYKERGKLDRINRAEPEVVRQMFPNATAMIVFPHYEPAEIMVAARDNEHLPPGISRHIIQGRAMRLNYPLDELRTPHKSLEEKNKALAEWMLERIEQRAVRFYAESTYLFDE